MPAIFGLDLGKFKGLARAAGERARRLRTTPGVGPRTAGVGSRDPTSRGSGPGKCRHTGQPEAILW
jgi:hypothetical protein